MTSFNIKEVVPGRLVGWVCKGCFLSFLLFGSEGGSRGKNHVDPERKRSRVSSRRRTHQVHEAGVLLWLTLSGGI